MKLSTFQGKCRCKMCELSQRLAILNASYPSPTIELLQERSYRGQPSLDTVLSYLLQLASLATVVGRCSALDRILLKMPA